MRLASAGEAPAVDIAMAEHQSRLFANGARPSGVLEYGKAVTPEILKRLRDSFNSAHAGGANAGKTLILEDGMSFKQLEFSSVDRAMQERVELQGRPGLGAAGPRRYCIMLPR